MNIYDERLAEVLEKIEKKKKARLVRCVITATLVLALALVLFIPYGNQPPSVRKYMGSPYYDLIKKINIAIYEEPKYDNLFSEIVGAAGNILENGLVSAPGAAMPDAPANGATGDSMPEENYQEVTDNQVAGVIEGDLIKRSDKYIYYLHRDRLAVYSIAEADSKEVGSFTYGFEDKAQVSWYTAQNREMYLSEDCTTVTLVLSGYGDALEEGKKDYFLCVVDLDVTDPAAIREIDRVYITGSYVSSRLVDGKLLLMSQYYIPPRTVDFGKPETYVPQIGTPGEMECVPASSIIAPDELSTTSYTVVTMMDQKTLDVTDTAAFLSYNAQLYVSKDKIFATRGYTDTEKTLTKGVYTTMTEIACMGYNADGLEELGSVKLEGRVKDQYSMDERDGVLRVVTSTSREMSTIDAFGGELFLGSDRKRNANLYCVSLEDWSVVAKVESFAPNGETVESVRFDGDYAYVCTAEVITLTDPVYFFDLSDLSNITWKDTGTIEGYSSSLVNFGNGNLIGIGFGEKRNLKIEAYRETETGVESICAYERYASFGNDYKSYYIDRENQLIGLGVYGWWDDLTGSRYILLGFDGVAFHELANIPVKGQEHEMRGVVIDGWLYVFSDGFDVVKIW